ncbi:MAG: TetR/AcrR family transcriptional regulator [Pontibacterium sp.]
MAPKLLDEHQVAEREAAILEATTEVINQVGVAGLTVDKVVAKVPYSKGTVYNHFSCKEDLLVALCNECVSHLCELFEKAVTFEGPSRERMLAVAYAYLLSVQLRPERYLLVITAKGPAVKEKASEQRQATHKALEARLMGIFCGVITHAIEQRELTQPQGLTAPEIAFSVWAMAFGTIALLVEENAGAAICSIRQQMVLEHQVMQNTNLVLDGLGWQPSTSNEALQSLIARFKSELFTTESEFLAAQSQ